MDMSFWNERWRTGQIGFHRQTPHWALDAYWAQLELPSDETVLVPLCGKSLDLHWLRQHGHFVEGIELDPLAIKQFFDEWPQSNPQEIYRCGAERGMESGGICLWHMDFFKFKPQRLRRAFYDRAALVALPVAMRSAYMAHLRKCLETTATGILVTLEYEQNHVDGPPFSVRREEVFGFPCFQAQVLERRDILDQSPKFRNQGVDSLHEVVYRLTAT